MIAAPGQLRRYASSMTPELTNAEQRYENFLREVKVSLTVWSLARGDQLALWSDEEGFILPLWSHEQEALVGLQAFPTYEVRSYALSDFISEVLPQLEKDDVMVGLNLDETMGGVDVSCAELKRLVTADDA